MQITDIVVHRVNIPLTAAYHWSQGYYFGASKGIVEVHTDEGITGLGEISSVGLCPMAEAEHRPRLIGADPLNIDECLRRCVADANALRNTHDPSALRVFGGIEIALWDIKGKALDVPVHVLLGGKARSKVAFAEYFAPRLPGEDAGGEATPLEIARYCAAMRERHGSTIFEGKVGLGDPDVDVAIVREVRGAIGPDAVLRLDANHGWTVPVARNVLAAIDQYNIANVEDPADGFREMAKLRVHSRIPFSSHLADVRLAVECGVPDTIVLNLTNLGGIAETIKFVSACEAFGVGFWFYSGDAGVATAAYLQVAAALPYLSQPHQSLLRWYADDVLAEGLWMPADNTIAVPDGPGLGITLDPVALARCKERFELDGPVSQQGVPGSDVYARLTHQ